jgi:hypothetical protein
MYLCPSLHNAALSRTTSLLIASEKAFHLVSQYLIARKAEWASFTDLVLMISYAIRSRIHRLLCTQPLYLVCIQKRSVKLVATHPSALNKTFVELRTGQRLMREMYNPRRGQNSDLM